MQSFLFGFGSKHGFVFHLLVKTAPGSKHGVFICFSNDPKWLPNDAQMAHKFPPNGAHKDPERPRFTTPCMELCMGASKIAPNASQMTPNDPQKNVNYNFRFHNIHNERLKFAR